MSRRYSTRSTTPVIDLTQETPRARTRVPKSRRTSVVSTTGPNPVNERVVNEENAVEIPDSSVHNHQKVDDENKATALPCFNNSFTGIPEIMSCSICFEALSASREPMATRCGHVFCRGCLAMSLKKTKNCPTCQSVSKLSTCIRLYF